MLVPRSMYIPKACFNTITITCFVQGHVWMLGTQSAVRKGNVMAPSPAVHLDFVTAMTFVIHLEIAATMLRKSIAHEKVINLYTYIFSDYVYFHWNPTIYLLPSLNLQHRILKRSWCMNIDFILCFQWLEPQYLTSLFKAVPMSALTQYPARMMVFL